MRQAPIPPCPHCHESRQGVWRKQQVHGWINLFYFDDGDHEGNHDSLVYGRYGPIRCLGCDHVRVDLEVINDDNREIVVGKISE